LFLFFSSIYTKVYHKGDIKTYLRRDFRCEIPLPDRACRRRLFDLYGQGLTLRLEHLSELIEQTEGVSAAFIRELMRKAALFAAEEGDAVGVALSALVGWFSPLRAPTLPRGLAHSASEG
jgi:hypothetical protein